MLAVSYGVLCLLPLLAVIPTNCAPRSKKHDSPHTVFDQKQTGDYNIQLHLKDFQIIALLAEDSGAFGDYDYNYDYSDFTVKPPSPATTQKPFELSTAPSAPTVPTAPERPSTPKPSDPPPPIFPPTTQQPPKEEPPKKDEISPTESPTLSNDVATVEASSTQGPPKVEGALSPGRIKVQVVGAPMGVGVVGAPMGVAGAPMGVGVVGAPMGVAGAPMGVGVVGAPMGVGVVPGEDSHEDHEALSLGEAFPSKRCSSGFTRDKRGRCRRVRRPGKGSSQLPYGFSRLASSLASRFRQASSEKSSSPSSESVEN